MATNTKAQDQTDMLPQEREDCKLQAAEAMTKVAEEYPEADIASKGQWWVPAIDFNFDVKVSMHFSLIICLSS